MAETTQDLRGLPKADAYAQLQVEVESILAGLNDEIAGMATISCLLAHGFGHLWAGFYRVVAPGLLRVGPYQGTLGCLEIAFGRGVCGAAAARRETVIVPDVNAFPGHIACDGRSVSEIVVPVFNQRKELIAVLDLDSTERGTFDEVDRVGLEKLVGWFQRL